VALARVSEFEHELGSGARATRAADPALAGILTRELIGYRHGRAPFQSWLEPPRPLVTLMIDLEGSIDANGRPLPHAWIGGLDETYTVVGFGGTYASIDLKLDPLGAGALLGMPLAELGHDCVALADAFGPAADELLERVHDAPGWDARFDVLEAWLAGRLRTGARRPDPMIGRALGRLGRHRARRRLRRPVASQPRVPCAGRDHPDRVRRPADSRRWPCRGRRRSPLSGRTGGGWAAERFPNLQDGPRARA
jgi:hypothetical protein